MRPLRLLYLSKNSDRGESATIIGVHRAGHDVRLFADTGSRHVRRIADAGVPVEHFEWNKGWDRDAVRRIRSTIRNDAIDIVHAMNSRTCLHMVLGTRGTSAKLVAYLGVTGNVSWLDPASWFRFLNPRIDRIVCVAEGVRQYLLDVRFLGLHLDPDKVVTIHKGHRLEWYTETPVDRLAIGIPDDAMLVTCSSRLRKRKGLKELILAVGRIPLSKNVHALFLGHNGNEELIAAASGLPDPARVHFAGFREDGPAVMAASDVCALPVLRGEGLSRAVIEAMAYAVPPVVTPVGGNTELVVDGECGLVVPAGDVGALAAALESLHDDPAWRKQLGQRARDRIGHLFTSEATIEATLQLYADLVN